ncbi:PREDICTED: uncharacterized protein LOC104598833 [Nelumbo nucifera]|uniref:Uncharacterized protein LOC104598833 n=1 Tax=Nelumbo nucifera TaxID=4432 RepID=A0A1U8ABB0_NELNU|nr:PREDICTED: uncharacterized protein LOC104598833 [Nelumbo nucifera]
MELDDANNGEQDLSPEPDLRRPSNGDAFDTDQTHRLTGEIDSTCSTPYVSAPSSPGRGPNGYFFSAPASPMHFVLSSAPASSSASAFISSSSDLSVSGSFEFEFSARFPSNASTASGSMISADELFLNGQIRPMKLSNHLQRPQILSPLLDLEVEDEDEEAKGSTELEFEKRDESLMRGRDLRLRNRSLHRRARSLSPLRNTQFQWHEEEEYHQEREANERHLDLDDPESKQTETPSTGTTPSVSASSSRSSSGRSSKRWVFLKDFLYRSKSEGRGNSKDKFWSSISFSPAKEKKPSSTSLPFSSSKEKKPSAAPTTADTHKPKRQQVPAKKTTAAKPANGVGKRRIPPSPHELHYTANRAQAEEMKKKTFLPYRQGLLGCLGFSSKSYGAMNGFARSLNPVSSR